MIKDIEVENWDEVISFIGHTTVYGSLEKFIVRTLGIRQLPTANTVFDGLSTPNDEIGLSFSLGFDDNSPLIPPKDTEGTIYLEYISIGDTYKGKMPFGLDLLMNQQQVLEIMQKESHMQLLSHEETTVVRSSSFFYTPLKITVTIVFKTNNSDVKISHINFSAIDQFDIEKINAK